MAGSEGDSLSEGCLRLVVTSLLLEHVAEVVMGIDMPRRSRDCPPDEFNRLIAAARLMQQQSKKVQRVGLFWNGLQDLPVDLFRLG
jgi:hypothetical protein